MVDEVDQLTFEVRDEFQRKSVAENVIKLLNSDIEVSPMLIDGGWGTGKTEFSKKLIHLIGESDNDYKVAYIDAFKADHADNALMTLLAAVLKLFPEEESKNTIDKALPILRFGAKTLGKAALSWTLRQDAADLEEGIEDEIKKAGDQAIDAAVESLLDEHIKYEQSLNALREALSELSEQSPIILLVDELDRCRPDFAVDMLESIKHIFNVDNVQVVLVTNMSQLRASINNCYGNALDAQRYLDKFVGYSFMLPQSFGPDAERATNVTLHHIKALIKDSELLVDKGLLDEGVWLLIKRLVTVNSLSLREVETFVRYLEIYQSLTDGSGIRGDLIYGFALFRILGVYIFCFKSDCANSMVNECVDGPVIARMLGWLEAFDLEKGRPRPADILAAAALLDSDTESKEFMDFISMEDDDERKKGWRESILGLFRDGHFRDDWDKVTSITTDVIRTLRLGG